MSFTITNTILFIYPLAALCFFILVLNNEEQREPILPRQWLWLLKLNKFIFITIFIVLIFLQKYFQNGNELDYITYDQIKEMSGHKFLYFIGFIMLYKLSSFKNVFPNKKI